MIRNRNTPRHVKYKQELKALKFLKANILSRLNVKTPAQEYLSFLGEKYLIQIESELHHALLQSHDPEIYKLMLVKKQAAEELLSLLVYGDSFAEDIDAKIQQAEYNIRQSKNEDN